MSSWLARHLLQGAAVADAIDRQVRLLCSGRTVPELAQPIELSLTTRCPDKWLSLDLETGEVWAASDKGWRRATQAQRQEAQDCLGSES